MYFDADRGTKFDEILAQVACVAGGNVFHEVGETVRDRVELVVYGLIGSCLAVLEECHHQERNDRRNSVDDQLPRVEIADQEVARPPDDHEQYAEREEGSAARDPGRPSREEVERSDPLGDLARHEDRTVGLLHGSLSEPSTRGTRRAVVMA